MATRTFAKAPSTAPLMLKAALPAIPGVGSLPGVKHASGGAPDLVLQRPGVATDADHLERYREVCGFGRAESLPVTYPHMAAFGLHMALMTDTAFPFAPMGLVHLRNAITQHRPIAPDETFDVTVRAADLRPHPKGRLIDLITDVTVQDEIVWNEVTTLFARGRGGSAETSPAPLEGLEAPSGVVHWKLAGNLGRRYGAVSGDRNPIHLYPLTAKAFGFPTNIAHGMWTKAHALAALANRLPDSYRVDVEFKKPILLPSTVVFGSREAGGVIDLGVVGARKPVTHMVGRVTPLA
ncbi:MaoC/PaaZ C-terminal domain-containing protein [Aeromicrobium sp.]|uniref:MaoC family dehydratase n=1 Tax=Aeromicrobium sp. TaxID=1871063 RepID=UPI0025C51DC2|nr:MaoC/PaaZ C-terminal domain-containing protein [Aeromicrobium sp.]MCK5891030.1 hypothetical protein [Aeromicrobium sp.]